jgi:hypothetical protein
MKASLSLLRIPCLAVFVFLAPFLSAAPSDDATVLTVDGAPVSVAEYRLVMEGRTAEVFNYFHGKTGLEDHLGYWKDDGKPENPIRRLRGVVTDEFRRIKTIHSLAEKKGLLKDASFAAFREGLIAENARRQKAVDNKEVIYGPRQYQPYRYYYFQLKDLEQALLEIFQKEPANAIPEPAIEAFYTTHKESIGEKPLSDMREQIARMFQKKNFEKEIETTAAQASVKIDEAVITTLAPRHDP